MRLLGQRYVLEALELAAASSRHTAADAPDDDALSPRPSREEIAAAWRRWARRDDAEVAGGTADTDTPRRRGLGLPAPRTGI
jgi:Zn-dependent M28 family amino/carboxypeptidase